MQGPINLGPVMSAHARFKREHQQVLGRELRRAGEFGVTYVQQHPTFHRRTGNLQDKTDYRIARMKSGTVLRLRNTAKYAGFVEFGTRPHDIYARGRALRFVVRGVVLFRRRVKHPGSRPFKFLYRATNSTGRVFETSMRAGMAAVARKF